MREDKLIEEIMNIASLDFSDFTDHLITEDQAKQIIDLVQGSEWISVEDELPEPRKMVLAFMPDCLVTQVYFSGTSFHEPWGDEYAGSKQPKWWKSLPISPPTNKGEE
jgi:hypothetical protein